MGLRVVKLIMMLVLICFIACGDSRLQLHFYRRSCPNAEMLVKLLMRRNMMDDPITAPAILRLAFHDCQVNGCDASILLRNSTGLATEITSDKNFGIHKLEVIHEIKSSLETICPETVSCADIIQLAAREAVFLTGGPYMRVLTGRRDTVWTSMERADYQLPTADISVGEFIQIFQQKNISLEDGVALMGSHSLGISHCRNFEGRLGPLPDPTLSPPFATKLRFICMNATLSDVAFAPNDATIFSFDNQYFNDILCGRGLLRIDSEIARDPRTKQYVSKFGQDTQRFFDRFSSGFLKLSKYKVLVGDEGEIRRNCRFRNS